jgi:DNA (cytosine-5)-methyltransferase 1
MTLKFVDLFAGLGGFHVGMKALGYECVFACEKNETLAKLYEHNFGIKCEGDIKDIKASDIPRHDILCAGFPCQPFSKAGKQKGFEDKQNGTYFIKDIARILDYHKPKYIILENVPHIKKHENEHTWEIISKKLDKLGYNILFEKLSPHQFGIPQIRERLFIVGVRGNLDYYKWPQEKDKSILDIRSILDTKPIDARKLNERQIECINLWQRIVDNIPKDTRLPSFPIWSMEFEANYPFKETTPAYCKQEKLGKYKGSFGKTLRGMNKRDQYKFLPSYAKRKQTKFPEWKQEFIMKNREFYKENKKILRPFIKELSQLPPSWQKLEWNCLDGKREIRNYLIQFRASGIRIKRTNYAPTLVLTQTQIPIVGWEERYITTKEAARLQSLETIDLPDNQRVALRALGNAVNAKVVNLVARQLIREKQSVNPITTKVTTHLASK